MDLFGKLSVVVFFRDPREQVRPHLPAQYQVRRVTVLTKHCTESEAKEVAARFICENQLDSYELEIKFTIEQRWNLNDLPQMVKAR